MDALEAFKARLKKGRQNAKQNKGAIMAGLRSYAQYGAQNPFNNVLTDAELDALKAEDLVAILHDLFNYKHQVLYYGPKAGGELIAALKPLHTTPVIFKNFTQAKTFKQATTDKNKVLLQTMIWYRQKLHGLEMLNVMMLKKFRQLAYSIIILVAEWDQLYSKR